MKLIEFLIRNWYIFIILLAVYAQFRNKASRGAREADRRTSGMPSFGGPVQSAPTSRQSGKETSSNSLSTKPSTQQQVLRSKNKTNDRRSLIDRSNERPGNTQPYLEGKERPSSPFSAVKKGEGIQSDLPDQEAAGGERLDIKPNRHQLAQGIIWSEIIGPPRAKKPYRR
jgi:hypothetical protein